MKIKEHIREDLWKAIQIHYEAEDYTEALRDASFLMKDILQAKSGEYDKDNSKLVDAVLSGQDPVLKINNFSTQTEKDIQNGIALGAKGIFMHVRNPISHEKIAYTQEDANAILMYINYLIKQIDQSGGVSLIEEWLPLIQSESFTATEEYAKELIKEVPKKKVYELLEAIYDIREELPKHKIKYFIGELVDKLKGNEKNAFIKKLNIDLMQVEGDYGLSMFFHFFAKHFYADLKKVVKLRIEDIIYQGIKNGKVKGEKLEGEYSATATWANTFIELFETSDKCRKVILSKVFLSEEEREYSFKFFKKFTDLNSEEVVSLVEPVLKKRLAWDEKAYKYIRKFIWDQQSPLYSRFKEEIKQYEEKHVDEKDRIPEEDEEIPF